MELVKFYKIIQIKIILPCKHDFFAKTFAFKVNNTIKEDSRWNLYAENYAVITKDLQLILCEVGANNILYSSYYNIPPSSLKENEDVLIIPWIPYNGVWYQNIITQNCWDLLSKDNLTLDQINMLVYVINNTF